MQPRCWFQAVLALLLAQIVYCDVSVSNAHGNPYLFYNSYASYGPKVGYAGFQGNLEDKDFLACSPFPTNFTVSTPIALIMRGTCDFSTKTLHAQMAGAHAVIFYDDEVSDDLIGIGGDGTGIYIPSVFVTQLSGLVMKSLIHDDFVPPVFISSYQEFDFHSFLTYSGLNLAMVVMLIMCCGLRLYVQSSQVGDIDEPVNSEFMTLSEVRELPDVLASGSDELDSSCCICLDDYESGDKLKQLPCRHVFHSNCVIPWLTERRRVCPLCKQDASSAAHSEDSTPLLGRESPADTTAAGPRNLLRGFLRLPWRFSGSSAAEASIAGAAVQPPSNVTDDRRAADDIPLLSPSINDDTTAVSDR